MSLKSHILEKALAERNSKGREKGAIVAQGPESLVTVRSHQEQAILPT